MLPSVQSSAPVAHSAKATAHHFLTRLPKVLVASLAIAATVAMPVEARPRHNNNDRVDESDIVKGVVASVLIGSVVNGMMQPRPAQALPPRPVVVRPQPAPVYVPQPVYAPAPVSIYSTPAARAFNSYSYYERQMIQRRLSMQGYYFGGLDASFGPGTYNAVVAYARAARLSTELASTSGAFGVYDSLLY